MSERQSFRSCHAHAAKRLEATKGYAIQNKAHLSGAVPSTVEDSVCTVRSVQIAGRCPIGAALETAKTYLSTNAKIDPLRLLL